MNALTYLPVDSVISELSQTAYGLRYKITSDAKGPFFYGWALGSFLLAGARCGNPREVDKRLEKSSQIRL
ncbi:MAG: hypothetical protein VB075_14090 [Petrimonas sp.]|uniref:hypothetical protein n=1 Tax=Petrimonas sp. TaxID=2023866 RepID=UPI002B399DA0|nr:hypothetical protein [Petrimonas sp.]MEA5045681.1 hypothetical protein [Petrimonas sp.]